jgi:hypothetical protein
MQSKAKTVAAYLSELPAERRAIVEVVRKVILKNLDKAFEEGMQYGMIGYYVPHSVYPAGYHCDSQQPLPFAALAAQKNYYGLYVMCLDRDNDLKPWFRNEWKKTGKKLDMGKACIRFKTLEDLSLDAIGQLIAQVSAKEYLAMYESGLAQAAKRKP